MGKAILVPTDFTKVARVALEHAVQTAKVIDGHVILLHVVEKPDEVEGAKAKLKEEAAIVRNSDANVSLEEMVRIGNIFDDIGDTATEIGAELIFMGTHGASGWQKIVGSHAMKVITHSEVPFIVVQDKGIKESGYDDIVVPLDLHKETKQKLEIVANMAKYFNSKVHLITPEETDEYFVNQLERNLYFAKNYLGERDIEFTTKKAPKKDFDSQIVEHANNIEADLITIMNLQKNSLMGMGLLGSHYEQQLITNKYMIPVLLVNPIDTTVAGASVVFG
jgi:nucleotide-binding universal stress UspA family protein